MPPAGAQIVISIVFFIEIRIQTILRSSWLRRGLNCNCAIRFAIPHGIHVETEFEKGARGQSPADQQPFLDAKSQILVRRETVSLIPTAVTSKSSSTKGLERVVRRNARRLWRGIKGGGVKTLNRRYQCTSHTPSAHKWAGGYKRFAHSAGPVYLLF